MKKIGILGLGIGSMYHKILHQYFDVVTIDIDYKKKANYLTLDDCLKFNKNFDLFIVATPNYLHKEHVHKVINYSQVVLVEKPGLIFVKDYLEAFQRRRNVFMTKNNMWREEFPHIKNIILDQYRIDNLKEVKITWLNKSRVPFPGFWFTDKEKSLGGTSKDSFPHLLSEFYYLFSDLTDLNKLTFDKDIKQNFKLSEVLDTDYGEVNPTGVYDVDDFCEIKFKELPVTITGCWKSPTGQDTRIGIEMILKNNESKYYDLDLCPEYCYFKQFNYFLNMKEHDKVEQFNADLFIHSIIEKL